MEPVRFGELVDDKEIRYFKGERECHSIEVRSVSTDTRSLKQGDLFIALKGERFDAHDFLTDALKKGASCILFDVSKRERVQPVIDAAKSRCCFIGVDNPLSLFGSMAKRYRSRFSIPVLAVTGSSGKTTTKGLIASVLRQRYHVVVNQASYNNLIGVSRTIFNLDTSTEFYIQELGTNHPGEILMLSEIIQQNSALITNIGPAHIGYFGSIEEIAKEKKNALRTLKAYETAFLNADDEYFDYLTRGIEASVRSFGLERGELRPESILEIGLRGVKFMIMGEGVSVPLLGKHGVTNACAAILVGLVFGLSLNEIKEGISRFENERGRGGICKKKGAVIIDESYNANPLSVKASIEYLMDLKSGSDKGRKIFVFGDMAELGTFSSDYHESVGMEILKSGLDLLFTYGTYSRITSEVCSKGGLPTRHFSDINRMIKELKKSISSGDIVLVKGSRAMGLEVVVQELCE